MREALTIESYRKGTTVPRSTLALINPFKGSSFLIQFQRWRLPPPKKTGSRPKNYYLQNTLKHKKKSHKNHEVALRVFVIPMPGSSWEMCNRVHKVDSCIVSRSRADGSWTKREQRKNVVLVSIYTTGGTTQWSNVFQVQYFLYSRACWTIF